MSKKKIKVNFLHIGKTGGSVIRNSLKKYAKMGDYSLVFNHHILAFHHHSYFLMKVPKGEKVVFFVREPISRFVSGFYSRKRKGKPLYNISWKKEEGEAFGLFETPNQLASALSSKKQSTRRAAILAMNSITHVKSSYWDWFKNKKYFISRLNDILFVGTQENLDKDFEKLKKILDVNKARLTRNKIKMHKNPPGLDKHLSLKSKRNLKKWYAKDFEFIKLCKKLGLI